MKEKIALILPPIDQEILKYKTCKDYLDNMGPYPPLNLLFLANALKSNLANYEIRIIDGQILSNEEIIGGLKSFKPTFVGISPSIMTYENSLKIARLAKSLGSKVAMGGSHASGLAKEILLNRGKKSMDYCVDAIIKEDGEDAISDLVLNINLDKIKNLVWRDCSGIIKENEIKNFDINKTGFKYREHFDMEAYFNEQQKSWRKNPFRRGLTIISQKGCAWRCRSGGCIFCARMNGEINIKNVEEFWNEVTHLINYYKADFIWDVRDDFLENEKWLRDLSKNRPPKLNKFRLQVFARIDNVNEKTLESIINLRLPMTFVIGFESGNNEMLRAINKGYGTNNLLKKIEMLKRADINIVASFVLGCPGENRKTLMDTLHLAENVEKIGAYISPHILKPLPNSKAFEMVKKRTGLKYKNIDNLDINELIEDWIDNFCDSNINEIFEFYTKIEKISS